MKRFMVAGFVAVFALAFALSALAQQGMGGPGRGPRGGGGMYDPSKAETVSGDVAAVKEFSSRNGLWQGVGLELKTGSGSLFVHLGPKAFLSRQAVQIAVGDHVEVTGVKSYRRGREVFMAGEVKKGGEVMRLRDEKGVPLWAGTGPGGAAQN